MRVLLICSGNTCRSPMAAGMLAAKLQAAARAGAAEAASIAIGSAGTDAAPGMPATPEAVAACRALGIEIGSHRSRRLDREAVAGADLLLAMEPHHVARARALAPAARTRIATLAAYAGRGTDEGIADPIGGGAARYRQTRDAIADLLERVVARLLAAQRGEGTDAD